MEKITTLTYQLPFYTQRIEDYQKEGFKSQEDADYWYRRGCGIASIRMIIDGMNSDNKTKDYGSTLYQAKELGAHCDRGWIHKKLIELASLYNIIGKSYSNASIHDLVTEIDLNNPCIVSVSPAFELGHKGGHLIVLYGYKMNNNQIVGFYVKHPSSWKEYNFDNYFVDIKTFEKSFSGAYLSFTK